MHLPVEEMAMTTTAQIHKLEVVLEELDKRLGLQDSSRIKWNVKRESCSRLGFNKRSNKSTNVLFCLLAATLHYNRIWCLLEGAMLAYTNCEGFGGDKILLTLWGSVLIKLSEDQSFFFWCWVREGKKCHNDLNFYKQLIEV